MQVDGIVAVSAGVLFGVNYPAKQYGRALRAMFTAGVLDVFLTEMCRLMGLLLYPRASYLG